MTDLRGRRAVVTGASRGIGAAITTQLTEHGVDVVRVSRTVTGDGALPCDLTSEPDVRRAVSTIGEGPPPHILINNAGSFLFQPTVDTSPGEFRRQLEVNLAGPFQLLHALLPLMQDGGHVVTIGSIMDHQVFPGNSAYAAAKHGLRALHEVVALEHRDRLRMTLVSPAATDTGLWDPFDPDHRDDLPTRAAMMRPSDVADAVLFALTRPAGVNVDVIRLGAV